MNAGAAAAEGDVLLFLHADTTLLPGSLAGVRQELSEPGSHGGCFQLRFDAEDQSLALRVWGACTRMWLFRTPRLVFGDRAIFVKRSTFKELEGFREWPLLEDLDFAMRLGRHGGPCGFRFLPLDVITSARRLLEVGPLRQQVINSLIVVLWYLGVSPATLRQWYSYKRPVQPTQH